jgi:hypothetical protein
MSVDSKETKASAPLSQKEEAEKKPLKCRNCEEFYFESENTDDSCLWYSTTHKGAFVVDYKSDFWRGWEEHLGPPNSSHCRKEYGNEGGYMWSICGCRKDTGECERTSRHKTEDESISDDDEEIPYETSDEEESEAETQVGRRKRLREYDDSDDEDPDVYAKFFVNHEEDEGEEEEEP